MTYDKKPDQQDLYKIPKGQVVFINQSRNGNPPIEGLPDMFTLDELLKIIADREKKESS